MSPTIVYSEHISAGLANHVSCVSASKYLIGMKNEVEE
jgi:hypothetical protein